MTIDEHGYYSLRAILGYGEQYNIVLSDRGRGKTWNTKMMLVHRPDKFMCLFRQEPDMTMAMKTWLDPLIRGDANHEPIDKERFSWDGNNKQGWQLMLDDEIKGYFRYLTAVNHIKHEVFPDDLNWVWMDEFIPLVYRKLPGVVSEGDAIRTIVKTIDHDSEHPREERGLTPVRVLLFANPFTWDNPILSYFHIRPKYGINRVGPGVVSEIIPPVDRKRSKLTVDDFLGDEVNRNQGWQDELSFIAKKPKGSYPLWSIRLVDKFFVIYSSNGVMYVEEASAHHKADEQVYRYGTVDGLREDEINITASKRLKQLQEFAWSGMLKYSDINTKFDFLNRIA